MHTSGNSQTNGLNTNLNFRLIISLISILFLFNRIRVGMWTNARKSTSGRSRIAAVQNDAKKSTCDSVGRDVIS